MTCSATTKQMNATLLIQNHQSAIRQLKTLALLLVMACWISSPACAGPEHARSNPREEIALIKYGGRDNTVAILPTGESLHFRDEFRKITKPKGCEERYYYLTLAMNRLTADGYQVAAMNHETVVLRRYPDTIPHQHFSVALVRYGGQKNSVIILPDGQVENLQSWFEQHPEPPDNVDKRFFYLTLGINRATAIGFSFFSMDMGYTCEGFFPVDGALLVKQSEPESGASPQ